MAIDRYDNRTDFAGRGGGYPPRRSLGGMNNGNNGAGMVERIPPQNIEAEIAVLGAMLLGDRTAIERATEVLQKDDFYRDAHGHIYETMVLLVEKDEPVDLVTMKDELNRRGLLEGVGGIGYLMNLVDSVATSANVSYHAAIVAEKATLRRLITTAGEIAGMAYGEVDEIAAIIDEAERKVFEIANRRVSKAFTPLRPLLNDAFEKIDVAYHDRGSVTGLDTGIHDLNDMTSGFQDGDLVIIAARPSMGKCHGAGTPIMLWDGSSVPVEQVRTGDLLMGPDSRPRRVLSTTRGVGPLYQVTPRKGMPYVVNDAHILSLRLNADRSGYKKGDVVNMGVEEYLQMPMRFRHNAKGWRATLNFPEAPTPLDPYFLGVWLGDGSSRNAAVTTADDDMAEFLRDYAARFALGVRVSKRDETAACATSTFTSGQRGGIMALANPVTAALRRDALIGCKHIPDAYKRNSRRVRLEVLAGIIDTDGYPVCGCYEIITKSERLADDYLWLARSLGFAAYKKTSRKGIKATNFTGTYWRLFVSGTVSEIPVRLARKQIAVRRKNRDVTNVGISVKPIGEGEYFGFEIDGDHLYLLGDFTVTHNTSLAMGIAAHAAIYNAKTVAVFSLEMGKDQLVQRMICSEAKVDAHRLRTGHLRDEDWTRISGAVQKLWDAPMFIDDSTNMGPLEMRAKCRRLRAEHGLDLVIVDYLQLMSGSKSAGNRNEEITEISRGLKGIAREMQVPVIALAQLSRAVERREDKRPMLSDLRDSGSIEAEADLVSFIYRPSYYARKEDFADKGEGADDNAAPPPSDYDGEEAEVIIGKHRNGPTGTVKVSFLPKFARFDNLAYRADEGF